MHEMGHFLEATRERLNPSWPVFIPFLGAYVKHTRGNPWQTTRVAIAGPILGGIGALACYVVGQAQRLRPADRARATSASSSTCSTCSRSGSSTAAHVWRSTRWLWYGGGREKAIVSGALYVGTALLLALGAYEAYLPQTGCSSRWTTAGSSTPRAGRPRRTRSRRSRTSSARGFEQVARIDRPAAAVFGSARIDEEHPAYAAARAVGRGFGERGWAVVTGGGPGVMEAANRGAQEGGGLSVGFNIALPHEQGSNAVPRHRPHLRALLRAQGLLREAVGGLRHLPRRLRHARRAVRGADADPDRQGAALPGRALRLGATGPSCSTGCATSCSPTG